MRGVNLSSPSVAYWHLQKLEACGLIGKNAYGEYVVKEKVNISGHLWIGRNLVPRLMCYSLFFFGIFSVEIVVLAIQFLVQGHTPDLTMMYLIPITGSSAGLFLAEGVILRRRSRREAAAKNLSTDANPEESI